MEGRLAGRGTGDLRGEETPGVKMNTLIIMTSYLPIDKTAEGLKLSEGDRKLRGGGVPSADGYYSRVQF